MIENETALPLTDDRGRLIVEAMSDSEKLAEILHTMRAVSDALESLGNNPMLKAMMPGGLGF